MSGVVLVLSTVGAFSVTQPQSPGLPFCELNKWGFMSPAGATLVEPTYYRAHITRSGTAVVCDGPQVGCVVLTGQSVGTFIPLAERVNMYSPVTSSGMLRARSGLKWGFVDVTTGRYRIAPIYDHAADFVGDYAAVGIDAPANGGESVIKWGIIDRDARVVLEHRFDQMPQIGEGEFLVSNDGQQSVVDTAGRTQWNLQDITFAQPVRNVVIIAPFQDGRTVALGQLDDGTQHVLVITRDGRSMIGSECTNVMAFSEGRAAILRNGLWGFIDTAGAEVVACQFVDVGAYHEGLAWVEGVEGVSYIDESGKRVVGPTIALGGDNLCRINDAEASRFGVLLVHVGGTLDYTDDGPVSWKGGSWYYIAPSGMVIRRCRTDADNGPGFGRESR